VSRRRPPSAAVDRAVRARPGEDGEFHLGSGRETWP
jgi:hypothetical protein